MRKFLVFILSLTLIGCSSSYELNDYSSKKDLENDLYEYPDNFIEWNDIFCKEYSNYYIYVFSYDCFYCRVIKKDIVDFYEAIEDPVYFIEYSKEIPISHNISDTIGAISLEKVFIKGTPTLIRITEKTLILNIAGKNEITNFIDLFLKNQ